MRGPMIVFSLLLAPSLLAHSTPVDHAWVVMRGSSATVRLTLPATDFLLADDNHDRALSAAELDLGRGAIEAFVAPRLSLRNERGENAALVFSDALVAMEIDADRERGSDHLTLVRQYRWVDSPSAITISVDLAAGRNVEVIATDTSGAARTSFIGGENRHAMLRGGSALPIGTPLATGVEHGMTEWWQLLLVFALSLGLFALRRVMIRPRHAWNHWPRD